MSRKLRALLAVAGATVFALAATPVAAPAASAQRDVATITGVATADGATIAACAGIPFTRYGYTGCVKSDSHYLGCDWDLDGDYEYFVIAPSRTIWHIWDTSGGWKEMPGDGRADDTHRCYINGNSQRQVEVETFNSNGTIKDVWYSYYSGGWKGWHYYPDS